MQSSWITDSEGLSKEEADTFPQTWLMKTSKTVIEVLQETCIFAGDKFLDGWS